LRNARRGRSRRSYALEIGLTAVLVLALYLFMTNGGPTWFGHWFAELMANSGRWERRNQNHRSTTVACAWISPPLVSPRGDKPWRCPHPRLSSWPSN